MAIVISDVWIIKGSHFPPLGLLMMFAGMTVVAMALIYGAILAMWVRVVRMFPPLERTMLGVALSTLILGVPGALIVGLTYSTFIAFGYALLAGWLGLFLPRIVFRRLAPGALL
jgi:hypothetical protein